MGSFSETYNPILFGQTSCYRIFSPSYNGVRFFCYITHYTLHAMKDIFLSMEGICYARYFPRNQYAGFFIFFSEITDNLPNGELCQFSVMPYFCSSFLIWLTNLKM